MSKKGLTLDERRNMIKALFNAHNQPAEEVAPVEKAPKEPEMDEEEVLEKVHVKRKTRYRKQQEGRIRPRGKR